MQGAKIATSLLSGTSQALCLETCLLDAVGVGPSAIGGCWSSGEAGRVKKDTLKAKLVEKVSVMAYEKADAVVGPKGAKNEVFGEGIQVVGGFVESEKGRGVPKGDRELSTFSFAVAKGRPACDPVWGELKASADGASEGIFCVEKLVKGFRGRICALIAQKAFRRAEDRSRRGRQVAEGEL
jgi:hypothetical protein